MKRKKKSLVGYIWKNWYVSKGSSSFIGDYLKDYVKPNKNYWDKSVKVRIIIEELDLND